MTLLTICCCCCQAVCSAAALPGRTERQTEAFSHSVVNTYTQTHTHTDCIHISVFLFQNSELLLRLAPTLLRLFTPKTKTFGKDAHPVWVWNLQGRVLVTLVETFVNDDADTHVHFLTGFYQPLRVLPWFVSTKHVTVFSEKASTTSS